MATLYDGVNLKLSEVLNEIHTDIHGHEILFEKTGHLEYASVYIINCNRKYIIDLASAIVSIKEIDIPDKEIVYNNAPCNSKTITL